MKKWLFSLLLISYIFAYDFTTSTEAGFSCASSNIITRRGYEMIYLEARGTTVNSGNNLVIYARDIAGFTGIKFYGMDVSSGNVPTTISAQPCFSDMTLVTGSAQIFTFGTPTTNLQSPYYKFSLPTTTDRKISFNVTIYN